MQIEPHMCVYIYTYIYIYIQTRRFKYYQNGAPILVKPSPPSLPWRWLCRPCSSEDPGLGLRGSGGSGRFRALFSRNLVLILGSSRFLRAGDRTDCGGFKVFQNGLVVHAFAEITIQFERNSTRLLHT